MVKVGGYYQFKKGNTFKVQTFKDGLYYCRVVNRYDKFYITQLDLEQKLFDDEVYEVEAPDHDLTKGAQIRGGQL